MKKTNGWAVLGLVLTFVLLTLLVVQFGIVIYSNMNLSKLTLAEAQNLNFINDITKYPNLLSTYSLLLAFASIFWNIVGIIKSPKKTWSILGFWLSIIIPIIMYFLAFFLAGDALLHSSPQMH